MAENEVKLTKLAKAQLGLAAHGVHVGKGVGGGDLAEEIGVVGAMRPGPLSPGATASWTTSPSTAWPSRALSIRTGCSPTMGGKKSTVWTRARSSEIL